MRFRKANSQSPREKRKLGDSELIGANPLAFGEKMNFHEHVERMAATRESKEQSVSQLGASVFSYVIFVLKRLKYRPVTRDLVYVDFRTYLFARFGEWSAYAGNLRDKRGFLFKLVVSTLSLRNMAKQPPRGIRRSRDSLRRVSFFSNVNFRRSRRRYIGT